MMIVMMILISGCYGQGSDESDYAGSVTEEVREVQKIDYVQVPYTQLLYTKTSPEFTWEFRSIERLDPDIQQLYDDSVNMAPGGWVLKETDQEIYILVSGGQLPSAQGFRIASVKMAREQTGNEKDHLYITLASQEDDGTEGYPGQASVTSLVNIPKSGLPDGAVIHGVSMTGVD
ncbi:hypothetical protein [Paenibacillus solani]|nr:hypothetical protein [Paenibacillus solani]